MLLLSAQIRCFKTKTHISPKQQKRSSQSLRSREAQDQGTSRLLWKDPASRYGGGDFSLCVQLVSVRDSLILSTGGHILSMSTCSLDRFHIEGHLPSPCFITFGARISLNKLTAQGRDINKETIE